MRTPCSGSIEQIADSATTIPDSWTDFFGAMEEKAIRRLFFGARRPRRQRSVRCRLEATQSRIRGGISMERRFVLGGLCALAIVLAGAAAAVSPAVEGSLAAPACDPIQTPPSFRGEVPTAEQVLGFPLGSQEVTSAESNTYVDAVDAA